MTDKANSPRLARTLTPVLAERPKAGARKLIVIGVAGMLIILGASAYGLYGANEARSRSEAGVELQSALEGEFERLKVETIEFSRAALEDDRERRVQVVPDLGGDRTRTLAELRQRVEVATWIPIIDAYSVAISGKGAELMSRCSEQRRAADRSQDDLEAAKSLAGVSLRAVQQSIASAVGKERLARILSAKNLDSKDAAHALAEARRVLATGGHMSALDASAAESSEIAVNLERAIAASTLERIADVEQNELSPSLARLYVEARKYDGSKAGALVALVDSLNVALRGRLKSAGDIPKGAGGHDGFVDVKKANLRLRKAGAELRAEVDDFVDELSALQSAQVLMGHSHTERVTGTAAAIVRRSWWISVMTGLVAIVLFVTFAQKIDRTILAQTSEIVAANAQSLAANVRLAKLNGRIALLHEASAAANRCGSPSEAMAIAGEAACRWGSWTAVRCSSLKEDVAEAAHWFSTRPTGLDALRKATDGSFAIPTLSRLGPAHGESPRDEIRNALDVRRAEAAAAAGLAAYASFLVREHDRVVACLEFFGESSELLTDDFSDAMAVIMTQLTRTYERESEARERAATAKTMAELSRMAGQSEIATGVLHNVGNVLNSVGVSASVVHDQLASSKIGGLVRAVGMMTERSGDLGAFLSDDAKGRQVPKYLAEVASRLSHEHNEMSEEVRSLIKNIEHVKQAVTMQQSFAKSLGVIESISVATLVNDALKISKLVLDQRGVAVELDSRVEQDLEVDRHRMLQILTNLITNAGHALEAVPEGRRKIVISAVEEDDSCISIAVADSGVGIAPESLKKIFSHGFTTRKEGHGFGLHSAALAAIEMGGSLNVTSDGLGRGATFTLKVPARARVCEGAAK